MRFWDPQTGKVEKEIALPENTVYAPGTRFGISRDGGMVIFCVVNRTPFVWRRDGQPVPKLTQTYRNDTCWAISPDNRHVSIMDHVHTLEIWDWKSGKPPRQLETGLDRALRKPYVEFSASGRYLLATRQIWDMQTMQKIWEPPSSNRSKGPVSLYGFRLGTIFPDERHVVIALDGQHQIWDFLKNEKKATLYFLPQREWAFVNHETGHWKGSQLAYQYLQFKVKSSSGRTEWVSPTRYRKITGWESEPRKALPTFLKKIFPKPK